MLLFLVWAKLWDLIVVSKFELSRILMGERFLLNRDKFAPVSSWGCVS